MTEKEKETNEQEIESTPLPPSSETAGKIEEKKESDWEEWKSKFYA